MSLLYKYIADSDAVQFLLQGTCKFTPIPELNDPSELIPNFMVNEVEASRDRLRQKGYSDEDMFHLRRQGRLFQRLAPQFQAIEVPATKEEATSTIRSSFYDDLPRLERLLTETAQEMSSKVGLFCLSQRYNSLPMWAHYARNATGLVVEFVALDSHCSGDDTGVLHQPIAVRYERDRLGVSFDPQSHESIFFAKFEDWSYEQEVRVVLPLTDCRVKELPDGTRHYFHDVPRRCIKRVILGWNMPTDKVRAVHDYARAHNRDVEIVQARFVRGRVDLGLVASACL